MSQNTSDETRLDRIGRAHEHDRDLRRCRLRRFCWIGTAGSENCANLAVDQILRQCWQPVVVPFSPAGIDRDVLALDVSRFLQALIERRGHLREIVRGCAMEESHHRHRRLLRKRRRRPPCRAAEQRDELTASHGCSTL